MSTKDELFEIFDKIRWYELEMRDLYFSYKNMMQDENVLEVISQIEKDEVRHANLVENLMSVVW